ncbi:MAG: ImmA/IrrE family metallo-endopeptidase [Corynebacterium sp.]|uniref:ImmA/IrrE family metallo-endopeptidase n=1 Tax=Corynebacterium sp. TaxID=1720 RepID=UPI0026DCE04B|nr:ImmA/IrrE family metallo-endopeptidase [Corynebacterium sp.]MDO4762123.1 ImmA/IrrE family metallo-endopeptidase [Corynebacterium sp.]
MSTRVSISPAVLKWAIERSGLSVDERVHYFPDLEKWLNHEKKPTLVQARKLAEKARIPFPRLLLPAPSPEAMKVADFRTVRSSQLVNPSVDLSEVLKTAEHRLAWYAEFAAETGVAHPLILGFASDKSNPRDAARKVRELFEWDQSLPVKGANKTTVLAEAMQAAGLIVERNSVVGNNTQRPLSVEEFRGFTLTHSGYALVFVNTRDSATAQLFSLAHELGHVVRATPGISGDGIYQEIEQWCNSFAAEFLMPEEWCLKACDPSQDLYDMLEKQSQVCGVSREALMWRCCNLGIIDPDSTDFLLARIRANSQRYEKERTQGPPFHIMVRHRVGERFLDAIATAEESGMLPSHDAARYLGVKKAETFNKALQLVRGGG